MGKITIFYCEFFPFVVLICKGHAVTSVKNTICVIELRESVISAFSFGFFPSS